jgi:hypothetical protein
MTGAGGWPYPTNKRDRATFAKLTPAQQAAVMARSAELYDGSRTVAAAWKAALGETVTR